MRVLTVRQPWAWAIIHGGKDIENRVRNIAGDYRGPVAIHVAIADADNAPESLWMRHADFYRERFRAAGGAVQDFSWRESDRGHIIGVVDLVDVTPWTDHVYLPTDTPAVEQCTPRTPVGWEMRNHWHLHFANPRAVDQPIPWKGALGLRKTDMFVSGDWIVSPVELPAGHSCTPYGCPPGCDSEPIARLTPTGKGSG